MHIKNMEIVLQTSDLVTIGRAHIPGEIWEQKANKDLINTQIVDIMSTATGDVVSFKLLYSNGSVMYGKMEKPVRAQPGITVRFNPGDLTLTWD